MRISDWSSDVCSSDLMYVKFGSAPTDTVYDCRPFVNGNNEACSFAAPQTGTYHVRVKAFSSFSGVSLVGSYSAGSTQPSFFENTTDFTINDNSTVEDRKSTRLNSSH